MIKREVDIVIGICERDGRFLFLQRKDMDERWDRKWEFPGGKIDLNEHPDAAVTREIKEETGIDPLSVKHVLNHSHDWQKPEETLTVHMRCYYAVMGDGEVIREEDKTHTYVWATPEEALLLDSLAGNTEILTKFFHEILPNLDRS